MSERIILCRQSSGAFSNVNDAEAKIDKHSFDCLMDHFEKVQGRPARYFNKQNLSVFRRCILKAMNEPQHNQKELKHLSEMVTNAQKNDEIVYWLTFDNRGL